MEPSYWWSEQEWIDWAYRLQDENFEVKENLITISDNLFRPPPTRIPGSGVKIYQ